MLTVDATLLHMLGCGVQLSVLVTFSGRLRGTLTTTRTFNFCMGGTPADHQEYDTNITNVSGIAYQLDPATYQGARGSVEIGIIDDSNGSILDTTTYFMRQIVRDYFIKGRAITVKIGTIETDVADFVPIWGGLIDTFNIEQGNFALRCEGRVRISPQAPKYRAIWLGKHPYEIMLDILTNSGVSTSFIDTDSFAYDYSTPRSHYIAGKPDAIPYGATTRIVIPAGEYDSNDPILSFDLQGATPSNTTNGKIYPDYSFTNLVFKLLAYKNASKNDTPVTGIESCYMPVWTFPQVISLQPKKLYRTNDENIRESYFDPLGISGSVVFHPANTSDDSISGSAINYLTLDTSNLGEFIDPNAAIAELCMLSSTALIEREDGRLSLLPLDLAGASVDTWTQFDTADFKVVDPVGTIYNRVNMTLKKMLPYWKTLEDGKPPSIDCEVWCMTGASQAAFADEGEDSKIYEYRKSFNWAPGSTRLKEDVTDSATTMYFGNILGIARYYCDNMVSGFGGTTASHADARKAASASERYCYFMLFDYQGNVEIVKIGATARTAVNRTMPISSEDLTSIADEEVSLTVTATSVTRAWRGTAYAWPAGTTVLDVTMAVESAALLLARYEWGCPTISCSTNLSKIHIQVGDFVDITDKLLFGWNYNGLSGDTFQVTSKNVDLDGCKIQWILQMVDLKVSASTQTGHQWVSSHTVSEPGSFESFDLDGFEPALDTAWQDISLADGWSAFSAYSGPQWRYNTILGCVEFRGIIKSIKTPSSMAHPFTLPTALTPATIQQFWIEFSGDMTASITDPDYIEIDNDGVLSYQNSGSNEEMYYMKLDKILLLLN
jgi:hypothetical protein